MVEHVASLGWPESRIILLDQDSGQSGSSQHGREPTCRGCWKRSSPARPGWSRRASSRAWSATTKTGAIWFGSAVLKNVLLADEHRIYDPADPQDRMVLGIQGAFNEFELSMILDRMHAKSAAERQSAANNTMPCRRATSAAIRPCARSTRINECSAPSRKSCTTSSGFPAPASYTCICSMKCSNCRW